MRHALIVATALLTGSILCPASAQEGPTTDQLQAAIVRAEAEIPAGQARDVNLPLAKLQLKKARLLEGGGWYAGGDASGEIAEGLRLLEMAARDETYTLPKSKLSELAYIAHNDGTVQPYYLHIPEAYDGERAWPLIVFLHGYVPNITVVDPWVLSEEVCDIAEKNGCILLIPYGRRNTDFQGVG